MVATLYQAPRPVQSANFPPIPQPGLVAAALASAAFLPPSAMAGRLRAGGQNQNFVGAGVRRP